MVVGKKMTVTHDGVTRLSVVGTTKPDLQGVVIKLSESMQASKRELQQRVVKATVLWPFPAASTEKKWNKTTLVLEQAQQQGKPLWFKLLFMAE